MQPRKADANPCPERAFGQASGCEAVADILRLFALRVNIVLYNNPPGWVYSIQLYLLGAVYTGAEVQQCRISER